MVSADFTRLGKHSPFFATRKVDNKCRDLARDVHSGLPGKKWLVITKERIVPPALPA